MRASLLLLSASLAAGCCRSEADRSSTPSARVDPGAPSASAAPPAGRTPPAATGPDGLPLDIPTSRTPAPTAADWSAASALRVPSARPLNCELNMIREWVRVSCGKRRSGGLPGEVKVLNGCSRDTYTSLRSNATLVTALSPSSRCEVEFAWSDSRELFVVEWARGGRPAMDFHTQAAPPASSPGRGRPPPRPQR